MSKRKVKKKQRKESKLRKRILATIVTTILMVTLPIFGKAILDNHQAIQTEFDTLATNVRNTADADEVLYEDCQAHPRNNSVIVNNIKSLRMRLICVTDQHALLGGLVSLKTYCMMHGFTSWNNRLQSNDVDVCQYAKSERAITKKRNAILDQIYRNKIHRKGMWSSFIEYFTSIRDKKYKPDDCL